MLPSEHLNLTIKAYQGSGNGSRWHISSLINWYCKGDHHLIFLPLPTCTTNSSKVSLHSITSKLSAISPNTPDCPDTDVWLLVLEAIIGNFLVWIRCSDTVEGQCNSRAGVALWLVVTMSYTYGSSSVNFVHLLILPQFITTAILYTFPPWTMLVDVLYTAEFICWD